ncbi:Protein of Unknown function (DUF2784) [Streptoalloteichus tenebrarius]|uniref:DUF2784 domain-containing protein n=1 Tax=Streptoalloteichus tenebrarius (strain ATCC 17920 / DSM 40477 / JCM 4838 / CBS 697.72 / NBRC 16177 / NCIMB 11028 / NRRL B-12390 / A12253. 1 / ISP 5477) TaxID=1933 RepID=A0ABT1I3H2_STRSD|nr:DUF2784 domain-containing protein [Streptoalloteichus tenebrarius]MCP2262309.1 Protein of Unknown function (DUF2784) [Streptoalloteichus tenebrarius]BFF02202.1 DUF2784 domain-containing protein [Streptoalloteichus tenebrarius]
MASLLAQATMLTHFAFLAYVVFGGFLAWRWPRAFAPHLVAVTWGALIVTVPWLDCPLTMLEDHFRRAAGQPGVGAFIDTYVSGVLYPTRYVLVAQVLAASVVAVSWLGGYLRWRGARGTGARTHRMGR